MPLADKAYCTELLYTGSALGTFTSSISSANDIAIPLSVWNNYCKNIALGPFTGKAFLAEWLTVNVEFSPASGTPTTVKFWLAGSDAPAELTPRATYAITSDGAAIATFDAVSTSIDISGSNCVKLCGYCDTGTVDINFITLTYSPK